MVQRFYGNCAVFTEQDDEKCKFYGSCCVDPMRLREKLARGTFSCVTLNTTHEIKSKSAYGHFIQPKGEPAGVE